MSDDLIHMIISKWSGITFRESNCIIHTRHILFYKTTHTHVYIWKLSFKEPHQASATQYSHIKIGSRILTRYLIDRLAKPSDECLTVYIAPGMRTCLVINMLPCNG